jgi:excisionase family DNA binding protein
MPKPSVAMPNGYQSGSRKSWTLAENAAILWKSEVFMAHSLSRFTPHPVDRNSLSITEFEPLLDSSQAAALLRIHPKTLQKMARRGAIHGTHIGKLWRFRASDLNDWLYRQEQAS